MSDTKPDAPVPPPGVSRKDADVANSGAAVWANKFLAVLGPVVKLVFLEQGGPDEPVFFRAAVVMAHQDAIALKNLLTGMLADIEKQLQGGTTPPNV
jgi:hypothetical protein